MQCAAYNKLGTGVHGFSHVVVGHIGLVVHNNVQHDMQGLIASVCVNHLARLSGSLMSNCPTMICLREQNGHSIFPLGSPQESICKWREQGAKM